jgi:hypothetical protein
MRETQVSKKGEAVSATTPLEAVATKGKLRPTTALNMTINLNHNSYINRIS